MARINLRDYYPFVQEDTYIEVSAEIADMLQALERAEESYERKVRRYKAYYSLDHKNGIERSILFTSHSPEELYERKLTKEELHTAIAQLPDKQAKRIYAHYLLGMSKEEIARAEGVSWHTVHQSIRQGLSRMEKILKNLRYHPQFTPQKCP